MVLLARVVGMEVVGSANGKAVVGLEVVGMAVVGVVVVGLADGKAVVGLADGEAVGLHVFDTWQLHGGVFSFAFKQADFKSIIATL